MNLLRLAAIALLLAGCTTIPLTPPGKSTCPPSSLGMETTTLSSALREKYGVPDNRTGVVVTDVIAGGPAARAGIKPGTVIVAFEGTALTNSCEFYEQAIDAPCDRAVQLQIWTGGTLVPKVVKPVPAAPLYRRACINGDAYGCASMALQFKSGFGHGTNLKVARQLLTDACKKESAFACGQLASWAAEAPDQTRWESITTLMAFACKGGYAPSCVDQGFNLATGRGLERNDELSVPWYKLGCDGGDALGCYNVGLMYEQGRGVAQDNALALKYYEDGCRQGAPQACTNAGFFYERGIGTAADASRAFDLYSRGCKGSACVETNTLGCLNWGRAYRDGLGVDVDKERAAQIFEELCEKTTLADHDTDAAPHIARACGLRGALLLSSDPATAVTLFHRACDRKDAFGCFNLAILYGNGEHVEKSASKSADFFRRACDLEDGEACYWLSLQVRDGDGVAADAAKAEQLLKRACELGYEPAC